jgi:hypothetical protein
MLLRTAVVLPEEAPMVVALSEEARTAVALSEEARLVAAVGTTSMESGPWSGTLALV